MDDMVTDYVMPLIMLESAQLFCRNRLPECFHFENRRILSLDPESMQGKRCPLSRSESTKSRPTQVVVLTIPENER